MRYAVLVGSLLLLPAPTHAASELRTWTSSDGNYVVRAELVDAVGVHVRLRKPDGSIVSVPINKLIPADRSFLAAQSAKAHSAKKKTPADTPTEAEKSARATLEQLGLRISSAGLVLADESAVDRSSYRS
ncbi:MAG: SHD1 domain-containing protein [Pirellulaceae bacterium]